MRSGAFLSTSVAAAALAVAFAAPASAAIIVNIDKDTQSMTVTVDGAPRYVWPVSTGRPGYDTPNGTFRPNRMDADHLSQEWDNAPMPHTIFFDLHGHAIHGFNDTRHIGSPASHGCVRLAPQNAAKLFALVEAEGMKDTTVVVSGRTPTAAEMARRGGAAREAAVGQPVQIAPGNAAIAEPPPRPTGRRPWPTGNSSRRRCSACRCSADRSSRSHPPPPQERTGFFGQPQQPPPYGQQQPYGQQPAYGQQPGYVRSSDGQLYYVRPGYQQQYYR